MRRHWIGIIGAVLLALGVVGAAVVAAVGLRSATPQLPLGRGPGMMNRFPRSSVPSGGGGSAGGYATPGERIFVTGVGRSGEIPRTGGIGMMGSGGCATCHGTDGRGGRIRMMMGLQLDVPDIRYTTLTSPQKDAQGRTEPGWTEAQIAAAIRTGRDANGSMFSVYMPRWNMDDQDMADLIAYLRQLK